VANRVDKKYDDDFGELIEWVNDAEDATVDARTTSEKCRDFYDSKQWSDSEARALKRRKQAPIVINRIKPKVDGLMGMERANRTTAKAYPRTPQHEKASTAASEAIRYVLDNNFWRQIRSAAWDNMLVEGTGGCEVIVKDQKDGFRITINHIMWDRIIYDPHSRRKDFSDARYLGQVVWLDYDIALDRFPDGEDVLETMFNGSDTYDDKPSWMDTQRKRVKIVEMYYLRDGDWHYACFTRGGYLKQPKISPYKNEEGETEHPYEFGSLFIDREGNRYGAVLQVLDIQEEINKRRSKALHLISVRQVRWERGAVEDINKTREELARPDGVVETTPGMEFEVLKTGDMAAAQFKLLEESKMEMDAVSFNAAAQGKEDKAMSGVALRSRELAAQTELAPMFDQLKHMDVRVYRKVWNRIKQYWKEEKWIRVTDDPGNLRWVGLNAPITKGQLMLERAQEEGMDPQRLQMLQQQIAQDPMAQEVVNTQNDVAELDVDIVIDDAPDSVTVQEQEFTMLGEMVKSGIPIPPKAIVKASSLKDKDQILKDMEQMQVDPEQVKKMQQEAQKLAQENQQLKANQQVEFAKIQADVASERAKLQMDRERMEAEVAMERERLATEIQLERAKAENEIMLEREKLRGQMVIAQEKAQNDMAVAQYKAANAPERKQSA